MPEQEYDPEDFVEDVEEDEDDDADDEPTAVFVGMTFGKDAADESFRVIAGVCDRLEIEAQRLPAKGAGSEALYEAVETSDFAIIDVSSKRPSLAAELECVDHEIAPEFIVLIARAGSPKLPEVENRIVHSYADKGDLRALVERHMNAMIDAWHEGAVDDVEDDEEE